MWNEPNAWTHQERHGNATVYSGGSYIYPSNCASLLAHAYTAIKGADGRRDVTLVSGGVLGHNNGAAMNPDSAGASYLRAVYEAGLRGRAGWETVRRELGSYPLDAVGQHLYLDQGGICPPEHVSAYLGWLRHAVEAYEGSGGAKPAYVTEAAWSIASVPPPLQARNLATLYGVCARTPYVAGALWYELQDNPAAHTCYGVADPHWARKPSFMQFKSISQ